MSSKTIDMHVKAKEFFERAGIPLEVRGPEDLEASGGLIINPPPSDGRCECCGREMGELTPFGGPGDPLVGDFTGVLLIKKWRPCGPYDEEAVKARDEAENCFKAAGHEKPLDWMVARYGEEKGKRLCFTAEACSTVGASWECRDCALLDLDEYYEKLGERYSEEQIKES